MKKEKSDDYSIHRSAETDDLIQSLYLSEYKNMLTYTQIMHIMYTMRISITMLITPKALLTTSFTVTTETNMCLLKLPLTTGEFFVAFIKYM